MVSKLFKNNNYFSVTNLDTAHNLRSGLRAPTSSPTGVEAMKAARAEKAKADGERPENVVDRPKTVGGVEDETVSPAAMDCLIQHESDGSPSDGLHPD